MSLLERARQAYTNKLKKEERNRLQRRHDRVAHLKHKVMELLEMEDSFKEVGPRSSRIYLEVDNFKVFFRMEYKKQFTGEWKKVVMARIYNPDKDIYGKYLWEIEGLADLGELIAQEEKPGGVLQ